MTQYNPQYPGYPAPPPAPPPPNFGVPGQYPGASAPQPQPRRRFPFVAGYVLWFSPSLWRDAGRRWGGINFFYLLILVALGWAVVMARWQPQIESVVRNEVPKVAAAVPAIDIKDGVVSADVPQPHEIKLPDGQLLGIIDTTGATTEPPQSAPSFLLTKDKLIMRDRNKLETHDLSGVKQFQVNGKDVQNVADSLFARYWSAWFPLAVIVSMVGRLIQMLIYGVIALLIASASSVRPPLSFGACMRLSALAVTPILIADTLLWALGVPMGCMWWIVSFGLQMALLVMMVRANDEPEAGVPAAAAGGYYYPPSGGFSPTGQQAVPQGYGQPAGYGGAPMPPAYSSPPTYNPPPPPPPPSAGR